MYDVRCPEVLVHARVQEVPLAAARRDRLLAAIQPERVVEVDDDALAAVVRERGWDRLARTGQYDVPDGPTLILNTFRWASEEEWAELAARYPVLRRGMLLGRGPWTFRDHGEIRRSYDSVCQSAWEIHCAFGCLHTCEYCHVPPFFNIMLDLEELAARVRAFAETVPDQQLYKFDNHTDTLTLEPEYGASDIMVRTFGGMPERFLLLYTKSDNVDHLLELDHNGHTLVSWSLNSRTVANHIEKGTPTPERRIRAMARCRQAGYPVRVRISPICPVQGWRDEYAEVVSYLLDRVDPEIISVDVVGWMHPEQMMEALDLSLFDDAYAEVVRRLAREGARTNGKHLFPHEKRAELLRFVVERIRDADPNQPVSLCNETPEMWGELSDILDMTPSRYACCCGPDSVPGHPLLRPARRLPGPGVRC